MNASPGAAPPLVISCDWIPPEFGAVGRYELIRAERHAGEEGRRTALIGFGKAAGEETLYDGLLTIQRLKADPPDKSNMIRRMMWTVAMNWRLLRATARMAARLDAEAGPDISPEVKVTGSPPFFAYLYLLWNRVTRNDPVIYRMSDFYPETAIVAGKAGWMRPLAPLFHRIRRLAVRIDMLGEDQTRRLLEASRVDPEKVVLDRDGSPVDFPADVTPAPRPVPEGYVALLYSGNLGVAHEPDTLLDAYRRHVKDGANRVRLWINGQGVRIGDVEAFCAAHGLPVFRTPLAELEDLPGILMAADAHLILLGDKFWGYVLPSKVYASIESGKPILFVGPEESDVDLLCRDDPKHFMVRNGDVDGALAALEALAAASGPATAGRV